MARAQSAPLTDEHCNTLDCVLRRIAETRELVNRCQNCGLDVSAAQEELARQEQLATSLKANFFPDRT